MLGSIVGQHGLQFTDVLLHICPTADGSNVDAQMAARAAATNQVIFSYRREDPYKLIVQSRL